MKSEIETALEEIRATFPDTSVSATVNADGGVYVTIDKVFLGDQWEPSYSALSFTITPLYPYADCYPHYVSISLVRKNGAPLGDAIHANQQAPDGSTTAMISQKNNRATEIPDSAAEKAVKVLQWMRSR